MTTTLVVCPECGSPVAPGRLSCQSCGTLLATVVGADRRPAVSTATAALPEIDEDRPLAAFMPSEPAPEPLRAAETPAPKRGPRRLARSKPAADPAKTRDVAAGPVPEQTSIFGAPPKMAPPILQDWSDPAGGPAGATSAGGGSARDGGTVPGAYLAPSATYAAPLAARPAARHGWPAVPGPAPAPFSPAAATWTAQQASTPPAAANGSTAGLRADAAPIGDTGRSLSEWLVIGGSTLAMISFILPWATDGVLGSNGVGYTAQWGLANGGHLLLIAAAAVVLLLHLGSRPVPGWIRSSALPLAVGGLLAGLAFAYYARPFGGGSGVAVLLAGAVLLLVGGLLASRPGRNATGASTV
ncbi:MAG: hypothetical protein ACXWW6_07355 [Candidatus Limnocylindrales bacterium]